MTDGLEMAGQKLSPRVVTGGPGSNECGTVNAVPVKPTASRSPPSAVSSAP